MSGASERASGGANGPVLYASISQSFYPPCNGSISNLLRIKLKERKLHRITRLWVSHSSNKVGQRLPVDDGERFVGGDGAEGVHRGVSGR